MNTDRRTQRWSINAPEDLGRAIAGARRRHGWSQDRLAEEIGVDRSYLARLESGASTPLVLERVLRSLRRLGARVTITLPDEDV